MKEIKYHVVEGVEIYPVNNFGIDPFLRKVGIVTKTTTTMIGGKPFTEEVLYPLTEAAYNEFMASGRSLKSIPDILDKYNIKPERKIMEGPKREELIPISTKSFREENEKILRDAISSMSDDLEPVKS